MTMTPYDFSMPTGLDVASQPIPYDFDMGEWETAWTYLLGAHPPACRSPGMVRYIWFAEQYKRTTPETFEAIQQYARGFLMFLLGTTLFSDRGNTVGLYLLSALVDLSQVQHFDWGSVGLATLYCYMSATSWERGTIVGGYWRAWELWVYAYFPMLVPELEVEAPLAIPYSRRFKGRCRPKPRETLLYLRQYFDTVRRRRSLGSLGWRCPGILGSNSPGHGAPPDTGFCLRDQSWFLGDCFIRQTMGNPAQEIPSPPPLDMRSTESLTPREVDDIMLGVDAVLFLKEGEYATYRHTYLMPPLIGVRTLTRRAADM
ncbi:protein MAIN-LIKE 2-like [Camellia sinensis]|uniref:protein MAIN-LIKE 2-like n=1 Tax=Camellia sinensis TaxID=4442 RepID=UPI001036BB64|nr:protein MAIN-LIKE 2-like [Camellia sinensis]